MAKLYVTAEPVFLSDPTSSSRQLWKTKWQSYAIRDQGCHSHCLHDAILAASFCPNIVLELSSLMPHHVLEVMAHVAADRLMIGSDLPESAEIEIGNPLFAGAG